MNVAACLSAKELADYLVGDLPAARAQEVEKHVDGCETCQKAVLAHQSRPDWLVEALPEATHGMRAATDATMPAGAESNWRNVLTQMQELRNAPAKTQPQPPLETGELIRDYRLISKLGEGGMGAVYKARHEKLGRDVALKLMHPHFTHLPHVVSRFEREMKAVGKLDHPAIVRATDAGTWEGRHYLAMEFISGVALNDLVRTRGPLPVAEACEIIRQTADALHYAHERGLVHRDVKPANLMLTESGGMKVLDMGLALLQESDAGAPELTNAGQFMGTLDYMAPEQASNSHTVDRRADMYSLGATLYTLLSGKAPVELANQKSLLNCLLAITKEEPAPLCELRPDVSVELAEIVHRMLRKTPDERFATLAEVAGLLAPFAAGSHLSALASNEPWSPETLSKGAQISTVQDRTRVGKAASGKGNSSSVREVTVERSSVAGGRSRVWWLAGGLAAVALVALGILLSLQTPSGTIEVELADGVDKDVRVEVKENGEVRLASEEQKWTIKVKTGEYDVKLAGGTDRFELDRQSVTVTRGKKAIVKVSLKPPPAGPTGKTPEQPANVAETGKPTEPSLLAKLAERKGPWKPGSDENVMPGVVPRPAKLPGIKRWQIHTKAPSGSTANIHTVMEISPDSTMLAVLDRSQLRLYDLHEEALRLRFTYQAGHERINSIAWSPDSKQLAAAVPGVSPASRIHFLDVATGTIARELPLSDGWMHRLAWSPDGQWLSATRTGQPIVMKLPEGKRMPIAEKAQAVWDVAWRPDSAQLAVYEQDKRVHLWNVDGTAGPVLGGDPLPTGIAALAWSPDGKWLAAHGGSFIRLWTAEGKPGPDLTGLHQGGTTLAWSADSKSIACNTFASTRIYHDFDAPKWVDLPSGGGGIQYDAKRRRFVYLERIIPAIMAGHDKSFSELAPRRLELIGADCSPAGGKLALLASDGRLLLQRNEGDFQVSLKHPVDPVATQVASGRVRWSSLGETIASFVYGTGTPILVWDAVAGRMSNKGIAPVKPNGFAWSPDGKRLTVSGENLLQTVSIVSGEQLWSLPLKSSSALDWSPDGNSLAYTIQGDGYWLLDAADGSKQTSIQGTPNGGFASYRFLADGRLLAAHRGEVELF